MIIKYTENEFEIAKSNDKLLLECEYCHETFLKKKNLIQLKLSSHKNDTNNFANTCGYCSRECKSNAQNTKQKVVCMYCDITFFKHIKEIKKTKNNFCSSSCAAKHNNTHKTKGIRRSKLENYVELELTKRFPKLNILFNEKKTINSELDIYLPTLNLAFELNGIFHYEPIFGNDKLQQTQNNDKRKFQACLEHNIELCIIDTSQQKYFKESTSQKYLDIIISLITIKLNELSQ